MASSTKHVVKITVRDFTVARFIKFSKEHSARLSKKFESLAEVNLQQVKYKEEIELHCQACEPSQSTEQEEFKRSCEEKLNEFLDDYCCKTENFTSERENKLLEAKPDLFRDRTGEEREQLFLRWDKASKTLTVAGLKTNVEEIFRQIEECVKEEPGKDLLFTFEFHSKNLIAAFIGGSSIHLSKLQDEMKHFATVEVCDISHKRSRHKKWVYLCKSLPGLALSEKDRFRTECRSKLIEFLQNYGSVERSFNPKHIEDVVSKEPDFLTKPQMNENVSMKWRSSTVDIVGLKNDIKQCELTLEKELDSIALRKFTPDYEISIAPPNLLIARFIGFSEKKHMKFFKLFLKDQAEVWIQRTDCTICFKAKKPLSQYDIPDFEKKCNKRAADYFRKFDVWSGEFEAEVVENAKKKEDAPFLIVDSDWMFEVVNNTKVNFVGLKPYFYPQRNALIKALKEAEEERKKLLPPPTIPIYPTYYYSPKEKPSFTIIKHVFQSPMDLAALQYTVGSKIAFAVYPDETESHGVEFRPKLQETLFDFQAGQPRYSVAVGSSAQLRFPFCPALRREHEYNHASAFDDPEHYKPDAIVEEKFYHETLPEKVAEFFDRFVVCSKPVKSNEPSEMKDIVDVVYRIGEASENIIERMISMHIEDDSLDIVGPESEIKEISKELQATIFDKESVPLTTQKQEVPMEILSTKVKEIDPSEAAGPSASKAAGPSTSKLAFPKSADPFALKLEETRSLMKPEKVVPPLSRPLQKHMDEPSSSSKTSSPGSVLIETEGDLEKPFGGLSMASPKRSGTPESLDPFFEKPGTSSSLAAGPSSSKVFKQFSGSGTGPSTSRSRDSSTSSETDPLQKRRLQD